MEDEEEVNLNRHLTVFLLGTDAGLNKKKLVTLRKKKLTEE